MTEVVAVFGVLLAVYTYIDSLYRNSIINTIEEKGSAKAANNQALIDRLRYQRNFRVYPLFIFSCIVFLLMLPDFITTLITTLESIVTQRGRYSISAATVIFVPIIFFYWVVVNIRMMFTIRDKIKILNEDKK